MISELVTNAVVHGASPIEVDLHKAGDTFKATVTDRGAGSPAPKTPGPREPHGRGLLIVRALAHEWGVIEVGDAKSVWFMLRCRQLDSTPI
jgi:anti-sigma regulatory factor (Ser/Thr protein kinase)